jgi:PAS domain S-box-containing protein/putative nucleotidyltransferase with HDIG domain
MTLPTGQLPKLNPSEPEAIRLLLVEDNPGDARLIREMLKDVSNVDLRMEHAATLKDGLQYLGDPEKPLDAVLLDLGLPDSQGFETFTKIHEKAEAFTVIILSGLNDVDMALHAVRNGAQDYLVKGQISGELLLRSIRHAIERDEADRLLRESRERYQSLVDVMPDAIMVHQQGQIAFVNPAAVKLLGAANSTQLIGRKMLDIVHPDYRELAAERMRSVAAGKSQNSLEEKFVRMDGRVIDVEVTGSPFTFEENPATQVIFRDITERKQREREIEAVAAVSSGLRLARSVDDILPILLDQAIASVSASEGTITLVQSETGDHLIVMGRGPRALPVGRIIPAGKGITSRVVETGQPYLNNSFRTNPDPITIQFNELERTETLVIVPITAEDKVIGTLGIGRETTIEQNDIRVLEALCNIGGAALHRAMLYEQTERRLRHLRSLREIDNTIATSLDLRLTLDVILSQAIAELRVDAAAILLLNEDQVLKFAAGVGFLTDVIKHTNLRFGEGLAGRAVKERAIVEAPDVAKMELAWTSPELADSERIASYYAAPLIAKGRVIGVLESFHRSVEPRDSEWKEFLLTLAGQAAIAIDNATLFDDLQRSNRGLREAYDRTIEGWAHALSLRDMETIEHSRRVTEMTVRLAQALGITDEQLVHVRRGALLHDIGKMAIPDNVLGKAGPLDDAEWVIMRRHPVYADEMLSGIEFLNQALPIPVNHHEKWDGSGYPKGLKGKEIPLEARIFAIIDVWDALTSNRPYRAAWPNEKVAAYLKEESGKHFDPGIVEAFFEHILGRE